MKFANLKSMQKHFEPGSRVYVSGFDIDPYGRHILLNVKPTYVELCTSRQADKETDFRQKGRPAQYAVPVLKDKTLDYPHSFTVDGLNFCAAENICARAYKADKMAAIKRLEPILRDIGKVCDAISAKGPGKPYERLRAFIEQLAARPAPAEEKQT